MKYCEKCGNKLKDGYAFCDKCGAKVEKTNKKEAVEKEVEISPVPIQPIRVKTGKGKFVFLIILNILLLASTITFLVLWLTKPTNKTYSNNNNNNNNKIEEKKEKNPFLGKWEQNIDYVSNDRVIQSIYGSIEFKDNYTFKITYYDKEDKKNTLETLDGTYSVDNNSVKVEWINGNERLNETYTLNNNKLCIKKDCSNYLVKSGNSKIVINVDEVRENIRTIDYSEYSKILNTGKDAIVVIVREGCAWCEKFESVVEDISYHYATTVYYYEYDNNIDVAGTPTTIVIKNGKVIDLIEGYKDFSDIEEILDDLEIK